MRQLLWLVLPSLLVVLAGCPQQVEPAAPGAGTVATVAPPSPDMAVIEAGFSNMGLQHPMSADPALQNKPVSYVVVDGNEVTVYSDTKISCPARVRLTGKWTTASGDKGGQQVEDRQFAAARWECIH